MYETMLWNQMLPQSRTPDEWYLEDDDDRKWLVQVTEHGLVEVGHYAHDKTWFWDSTHRERDSAVARVNFLNGGRG